MSIREFIRENRAELDDHIQRVAPGAPRNDQERRLWIDNDEELYLWFDDWKRERRLSRQLRYDTSLYSRPTF